MSRYIDADKLIDDLEHDIAIDQDHILYVGTDMREKESIQFDKDCKQNCIDMLSKAPTADVRENVKGKWIIKTDGFVIKRVWGVCSECGNTLDFSGVNAGRGDANFCPNCGAYMRGDQT